MAVEVELDAETGLIDVTNVVCAIDVGRAINPQLVTGQIEGAIVQAHGFATMENLQMSSGRVLTSSFHTYLIPGVCDIPRRIESVILEHADPTGPWGARGMAEMPFIPYAAALVSALHDATGIWFTDLPVTPNRLARQSGVLISPSTRDRSE